jgi:hypothetical protein
MGASAPNRPSGKPPAMPAPVTALMSGSNTDPASSSK